MFIPFDNEAKNYDDWYKTKLGAFVDKIQTRAVMSFLQPLPGDIILDLGCGTGNYSIKLAKKDCWVKGIDVSPEMMEIAADKAEKLNLDIDFMLYDGENIPFPDDYFDKIVSVTAWEFIENRDAVFDEAMRVLKPGGKLVIGTLHALGPWGDLYNSDYYKNETVFKYAELTTIDELTSYAPDEYVDSCEALFISPHADDETLEAKSDSKKSAEHRGGFICVLWKK